MKFKTVLIWFLYLTVFLINLQLFPLIGRLMSSPNSMALVFGTLSFVVSIISLFFIIFKMFEGITKLVKDHTKNNKN
jgi:hypothetical protein